MGKKERKGKNKNKILIQIRLDIFIHTSSHIFTNKYVLDLALKLDTIDL